MGSLVAAGRGCLLVRVASVAALSVACSPSTVTPIGAGEAQVALPSKPDATLPVGHHETAPGPSDAGGCTQGETQPCALVSDGCPIGLRTCHDGQWGACLFDNPGPPPRCTTQCSGGLLSGESLFAPVNRFDALRPDWAPSDLLLVPARYRTIDPLEKMRVQALGHMVQMLSAQRRASTPKIYCGSPYRSFGEQCQLFGQYVAQDRCAKANTYSAMAGHSEHQLGTVCDMVYADNGLIKGNTPGDAWLAEHAYEYGFLQSYPEGTSALTGYETEPWHFRYLGRKAALMHHRMQQAASRTISTHELIATIACWPAMKVDELATEAPDDAAQARAALCADSKDTPCR
jgi:LAS superfamily LD-carboxypeptidase LdcB